MVAVNDNPAAVLSASGVPVIDPVDALSVAHEGNVPVAVSNVSISPANTYAMLKLKGTPIVACGKSRVAITVGASSAAALYTVTVLVVGVIVKPEGTPIISSVTL